MNPHDPFRERLVLRVAGELDADDVPAVDAHLAVCAACREDLFDLMRLAPPPSEAADAAADGAYASWRARVVEGTLAPRRRAASRRRGLLAAACLVLGAALGVLGAVCWTPRPRQAAEAAESDAGPKRGAGFALASPPPAASTAGRLSLLVRARGG